MIFMGKSSQFPEFPVKIFPVNQFIDIEMVMFKSFLVSIWQ